jgi:hypothetical protein
LTGCCYCCCYSTPYNLDAEKVLYKKGITFKALNHSSACWYSAQDKQLPHNSPAGSSHPEIAHHTCLPVGPTPSCLNSYYTYVYLIKIHFQFILLFTPGRYQYTKQRPANTCSELVSKVTPVFQKRPFLQLARFNSHNIKKRRNFLYTRNCYVIRTNKMHIFTLMF